MSEISAFCNREGGGGGWEREGSTSLSNDNSANLSGEKKYNEELRGVYFLTVREKTLNQISYS